MISLVLYATIYLYCLIVETENLAYPKLLRKFIQFYINLAFQIALRRRAISYVLNYFDMHKTNTFSSVSRIPSVKSDHTKLREKHHSDHRTWRNRVSTNQETPPCWLAFTALESDKQDRQSGSRGQR